MEQSDYRNLSELTIDEIFCCAEKYLKYNAMAVPLFKLYCTMTKYTGKVYLKTFRKLMMCYTRNYLKKFELFYIILHMIEMFDIEKLKMHHLYSSTDETVESLLTDVIMNPNTSFFLYYKSFINKIFVQFDVYTFIDVYSIWNTKDMIELNLPLFAEIQIQMINWSSLNEFYNCVSIFNKCSTTDKKKVNGYIAYVINDSEVWVQFDNEIKIAL
ncbi:hypothetical protein A3Q56_02136 [Intoshia linei]|uniref:Uncharacterized protein n=1 Tax=Intoshia linei TaxID=1819745 RepID=A0A177B776_9BILA|nr:hypothetical protein A3Q56_02136 [Intoshia linei]